MSIIISSLDNTIVSSGTIRKDFYKDYGTILSEHGFVKHGNTFYRIHNSDVLLYVTISFFRSEWTITFASYAFASAYEDMKGYDGIRMSSLLRHLSHNQEEINTLNFHDRRSANYQHIREQYLTFFLKFIFPIFNNITSIETFIKFKNWYAHISRLIPDYENMALASFQAHAYNQGASYLKQYLQDTQRAYRHRIIDKPDDFTKTYEMYTVFVNDISNNYTANIDAYIKNRISITANTCSELGLIVNKA